jgi:phosphatidylglycerol lysyltransferase
MRMTLRSFDSFRQAGFTYIRENTRLIGQAILTVFFITVGIWFVLHEQTELHQVRSILSSSSWEWLLAGIIVTGIYVLLQALMYVASFAAIGSRISLEDAVVLFLKRNFISVFLPAGGLSSLAFFTDAIESKGITRAQIHLASSVYAFVGILSVVLVAFPAFFFALADGGIGSGEWAALGVLTVFIFTGYLLYRSVISRGFVYQKTVQYWPSAATWLEELGSNKPDRKHFTLTVLYSVFIELAGIAHVYIAMVALHLEPSFPAAVFGYIVAVIFLIVSPFLRGIGAIEVSMAYILVRFGFTDAAAISITFFYRFLEFWLPLFAGAISFLLKINKLLMRIFPALLLLLLGIVNIISVVTPAIGERLHFLKAFLPTGAITASNFFVLITGLFLLVTAAFMLKGLRTAWYFALVLCILSIIGNLTKAIDYEESAFALLVLIILLVSRKEYYIKNSRKLGMIGLQTILLGCLAVLIYGCIGFYFLDKKHFNIDFSLAESVSYTFQNFFLIGSDIVAQDSFARNFLYSIKISGFLCIAFLVYTLVQPYFIKSMGRDDDLEWAKTQLDQYGNSGIDYFKSYPDKLIYRSDKTEGFVAYRVAGDFAIALAAPTAAIGSVRACVQSFDNYCLRHGLKSLYFRVPEENLDAFQGKKKLFLGQEGVMDLTTFSLEGGARKSIRNALKKITDKGYHSKIYTAPLSDGLIQRLKAVSDEWLADTGRSEIVFSQGMFLSDELKMQTVITVESPEEKIVAFLNIIPDYAPGEGTYDLIRKTRDAPNGTIDFITVEMFQFLKNAGCSTVNLGFAPLSGIADPRNFPERSMKFAYEKISAFSHYQGLRAFKEKFSPVWYNKYLVYDQDYDLFKVPAALAKVIKPHE